MTLCATLLATLSWAKTHTSMSWQVLAVVSVRFVLRFVSPRQPAGPGRISCNIQDRMGRAEQGRVGASKRASPRAVNPGAEVCPAVNPNPAPMFLAGTQRGGLLSRQHSASSSAIPRELIQSVVEEAQFAAVALLRL